MGIRNFLYNLELSLPSILFWALVPSVLILLLALYKQPSSKTDIFFRCLIAGMFMTLLMAYWRIQGFFVHPLWYLYPIGTTDFVSIIFTLGGGIAGGFLIDRGVSEYKSKKELSNIALAIAGYLILVFITFSILSAIAIA